MRFHSLLGTSGAGLACALVFVVAACSSDGAATSDPSVPNTTGTTVAEEGGTTTNPGDGSSGGIVDSGGVQPAPDLAKLKAQMLTSFWENDTTVFQYGFARNNNDGYGYTAGRIGFTTGTGDAYYVVKCFDAAFKGSGNLLGKYESALKKLNDQQQSTGKIQGDTSTLDALGNFPKDWTATFTNASTKGAFVSCQDQSVDSAYWSPTLPFMQKWGLTSALARASVYDTFVVHGDANANNLAKQANDETGNTAQKPATAPLSRAAESAWLQAFHAHRMVLLNGSAAWRGAIARGANYEQQRRDGNFDFSKSVVTDAKASVVYPGKGYPANGYQACVIHPDGSVTGDPQCTAPVSN
jgi:chitosanase